MPAQRKAKVGDVIEGKYKLEKLIGEGGMGQVYRAMHLVLGRAVAVKVMPLEHAQDERLVQRFLMEAHAAAKVRHPHIVEVVDAGSRVDGSPYIVQELLEGETLDKFVLRRGGRLDAREALRILIPIVDAIAALHEAAIIHRDIKPENVFLAKVGSDTVPKLLDFGISREIESEVRLTTTGTAMGTPAYMSPEQVNGRKTLDARSDIWALGVVLYELVAGQLPFEGETAPAMFGAIANTEPIPLEFVAPDTPTAVVTIVRRCLERVPAARYHSARDLEDAMGGAHSRLLRKAAVADTTPGEQEAPPSAPTFDLPDTPPSKPKVVKSPPVVIVKPAPYDPSEAMMLGHELPNLGMSRSPHEHSKLELHSVHPSGKRSGDRDRGGLRHVRESFGRDPFGAWYVGAAILSATSAACTVVLSTFVEGPNARLLISSLTEKAMDTSTSVPHVFSWTILLSFAVFLISSMGQWPRAIGRTFGYGGVVLMAAVWGGVPLTSLFRATVPSDVVEKGALIAFAGIGIEVVARGVEWWTNGRARVFPVMLTGVAAGAFWCVLRIAHIETPRPTTTVVVPAIELPAPRPARKR